MKTVDEFSASAPARAGSVVSVLVVDDEAAVRRFACRVLERAGYGVFEAIDGVEALELIQGQALVLDLVVSDIVMPRMNGVELMQALSVSRPGLAVILMSGYATTALSELGIVAPCSIVTKPFSAERLLAEVYRCIPRPGGGSSAA
ncbi:MAG: two-component system, cell cycle sensor histidine kinase and response regulator CckA [Gemmatimonadales bacterium]|jgi:DNA-binding NtrC family response regulator|nr:two-component system, cell cycle sensor histidine kinase and response regulator CckA [Gemmatimonadales bacterium]